MTTIVLKVARLDAQSGGYPLTLRTPQGPVAAGLMALTAAETQPLIDTVIGTPGAERPQLNWAPLTTRLFDLLLPPGPLRDHSKTWPPTTTLYLEIEPEELQDLPWELACSPQPLRPLSLHYRASRLHAPAALHCAAARSDWPFRILIVVGCAQSEEAPLEVRQEIDLIRRAFVAFGRSVDVRVIETPSYVDLSTLITGVDAQGRRDPQRGRWEPHVLHFIGHTALDGDGSVGLKINRSEIDADNWTWSSTSLQVQLPLLGWVPRFVFLNACRTAEDGAGVWGMRRSFIAAGTECVLTLQADVQGHLAGVFAGALYQAMAEGQSVQDAVLQGRRAVYGKANAPGLIDWALPSLSACAQDLKLFVPRQPPQDPHFIDCVEFREARIFANCHDARRLLTHWVCPVPDPSRTEPNVLLLTGEPSCGKSHLLKWAMESWALSGARVRYIELYDNAGKDLLLVLRQIRDGDGPGGTRYLQRPLPAAAFKRFNWTLNNLLRTGQPGEWVEADHPETTIDDDGLKLTLKGEERLEPAICQGFHNALQAVAREKPLILVFDSFTLNNERMLSPEDFRQLLTHLFRPIALESQGRIKLAFSVTPTERAAYQLADLAQHPIVSYVLPDNYPPAQLVEYAAELLQFNNEPLVREAAELFLVKFPEERPWRGIARLKTLIKHLPHDWFDSVPRMR